MENQRKISGAAAQSQVESVQSVAHGKMEHKVHELCGNFMETVPESRSEPPPGLRCKNCATKLRTPLCGSLPAELERAPTSTSKAPPILTARETERCDSGCPETLKITPIFEASFSCFDGSNPPALGPYILPELYTAQQASIDGRGLISSNLP